VVTWTRSVTISARRGITVTVKAILTVTP
jgi:hypothetical protein